MNLLERMMSILDLENPDTTIQEANKKLLNTYMVVNGELLRIAKFDFGADKIAVKSPTGVRTIPKNISLDIYLPEAGLYPSPYGDAMLIKKIPYRQWLKSFNESFYQIEWIGANGFKDTKKKTTLNDVFLSNRVDIFVDSQKIIWYWGYKIGHFNESNNIICTDDRFYQELKDWSINDYRNK